jgi:hypothetical protein
VVDRDYIGVVWNSVFEIIGGIAKQVNIFYFFVGRGGVAIDVFYKISYGSDVLFARAKFLVNGFKRYGFDI